MKGEYEFRVYETYAFGEIRDAECQHGEIPEVDERLRLRVGESNYGVYESFKVAARIIPCVEGWQNYGGRAIVWIYHSKS